MARSCHPINAAEALLQRMKHVGVDYLFANGGTDFAPVIEAYAHGAANGAELPEPLVIPHESVAMGMAHGHYLATGRAQAVMVHVNVGLANTVMGAINAASDNIPLLLMAGRTPLTEGERLGARDSPIQYGQEMRDQAALVRESTKWDYELRFGEQAASLVDRAYTIATTAPRGPVFLGLPREPLAESWSGDYPLAAPVPQAPATPAPDPGAIARAAEMIAAANNPLIIGQRGDPEGRLGAAVAGLAREHAIGICEFWPVRNLLATDHPMHMGFDVGAVLPEADLIIALDAQVPWIRSRMSPSSGARVIHIGPDPLFQRLPMRSFPIDIAVISDPARALAEISDQLGPPAAAVAERYERLAARSDEQRAAAAATAARGGGAPMSAAYVSQCLSNVLDEDALVFSELGISPAFMKIAGANRCFSPAYSGGLGWGLPAALGAQLADRKRLVIACVGDGSYTFANPVACNQVAEALDLPVLTVIMRNDVWNAVRREALAMYPDGKAAAMNRMPITSLTPSPDYAMVAAASRGWSERVETGADLPAALARAVAAVRIERRQATLELAVGVAHVPGT